MVTIPTVLILGAGASVHVGYPLGRQLVSNVCRLRGSDVLDLLPEGWSRDDAEVFLERLSRSGHYSIDAFLETVPSLADLGKFFIAKEMKAHEDLDNLFPPNNSGWYQYLFNALLAPDGRPWPKDCQIGIVTFNYDRSLEAYLHAALQGRFGMDSHEAALVLARLRIVHVHGILGGYPSVPYQRECELDELVEVSRQIQIIHEISDRDGEFCNPMFREANDMLRSAERILFLGFGFHPDNVRRFRFFSEESLVGKTVRGTMAGLGPVQHVGLLKGLREYGLTDSMLPRNGYDCDSFFTHLYPLE